MCCLYFIRLVPFRPSWNFFLVSKWLKFSNLKWIVCDSATWTRALLGCASSFYIYLLYYVKCWRNPHSSAIPDDFTWQDDLIVAQGVRTAIKKPPAKFGIFHFYLSEETIFEVNNYLNVLVEKCLKNTILSLK